MTLPPHRRILNSRTFSSPFSPSDYDPIRRYSRPLAPHWLKLAAGAALVVLVSLPAFADERPPAPKPNLCAGDSWRGNDKTDHILIGTGVAFATTLGTKSPWTGFAAGAALGILKEVSDKSGGGCSSSKDLAVTLAGAAVGAFLGKQVLIYQDKKTTIVAYHTEF